MEAFRRCKNVAVKIFEILLGAKGLRWVWKFKTSLRQLAQYLIHHTGNPAAVR